MRCPRLHEVESFRRFFGTLDFYLNIITGAVLDVFFTFYPGSNSADCMMQTSQVVSSHWELPNGATPCVNGGTSRAGIDTNRCANRVRVVANPSASETFRIVSDGVIRGYVFAVTGFDAGDPFWTAENAENTAMLRARCSPDERIQPDQPAPVPLPPQGGCCLPTWTP